jgi:dolichol-phosphate mannosyltransferase
VTGKSGAVISEAKMYDLTVIIPTYNEVTGIADTVNRINREFTRAKIRGEIVIVDDNSTDGTITEIRKLQMYIPNLRLVLRKPLDG